MAKIDLTAALRNRQQAIGTTEAEKRVSSKELLRELATPKEEESVTLLPTARITRNRYQPRLAFSVPEMENLKVSIAASGNVLQPILVRKVEDLDGFDYELIAGERRLRSCIELGIKEIRAIIRVYNDDETAMFALLENIDRQDLCDYELYKSQQRMIAMGISTNDVELATLFKVSEALIKKRFEFSKLPEIILDILDVHPRAMTVTTQAQVRKVIETNEIDIDTLRTQLIRAGKGEIRPAQVIPEARKAIASTRIESILRKIETNKGVLVGALKRGETGLSIEFRKKSMTNPEFLDALGTQIEALLSEHGLQFRE